MRSMNRFVITLITIGALLCRLCASAQETAPKPDLVVDKINLNPSGNIVVEIRNAGPGPIPDNAWRSTESYAACFVIMIGVQFVDYATLWAADPNRALKNPGGTITYRAPPDPGTRRLGSGWTSRSRSKRRGKQHQAGPLEARACQVIRMPPNAAGNVKERVPILKPEPDQVNSPGRAVTLSGRSKRGAVR